MVYDSSLDEIYRNNRMKKLIQLIQQNLSDDLRREPYKGNKNPLVGHCYVATEALYHFLKAPQWQPCFIRHKGHPHWFLKNKKTGGILDITAGQFKSKVSYEKGIPKGFLTKKPSKRAKILLKRIRKDM